MTRRRGAEPKPKYLRFNGLPWSVVYVIEFGALIKIGRAHAPSQRFRELHRLAARNGLELGSFVTFHVRDMYSAELECLHAMRRLTKRFGRSEYFSGISFDVAAEVARRAVGKRRV